MERTRVYSIVKMKIVILVVLTGSLLLSSCTAKEGIEIRNAWMRQTAQGENGAVYFVLHNYSAVEDELIGVSAEIAQAVEIHESTMTNDVMQMRMLSSVPLEASAEVEFSPGGLHIMLVGLKREINIGDSIKITLHFKNNEDSTVHVPVQQSGEGHEH